jgi:hypothetical protein
MVWSSRAEDAGLVFGFQGVKDFFPFLSGPHYSFRNPDRDRGGKLVGWFGVQGLRMLDMYMGFRELRTSSSPEWSWS